MAVSALAVSVFAQGTIVVGNVGTSLVQKWTSTLDNTLQSVPASGGMVQFLAAPDGTAFSPLGVYGTTGFNLSYQTMTAFLNANAGWNAYGTANIAPVAGRFNGGTATVSPLTPGGNIEYVMIGWTGASPSLDAAINAQAMVGQSTLVKGVATGNPTTTPPGTATLMSSSFAGMTLAPIGVPEPSTFALLGLGAAAMLIFRRK